MPSDINILLIQPDIRWEAPKENIQILDNLLARQSGSPDLIVFPEMFLTGFNVKPLTFFENDQGEGIEWMKNKAKLLHSFVCGSLTVKINEVFHNRFYWVGPNGSVDHYDKRHLFSMGLEDEAFARGWERKYFSAQDWKIFPSICYDLRFPVWHRNNAEEPYDILINVANWPSSRMDVWRTLLKARAIENQCYVVGCNRVGQDKNGISYTGESMVVDPKGNVLVNLGRDPKIAEVKLSHKELVDFRTSFPVLKDADSYRLEP